MGVGRVYTEPWRAGGQQAPAPSLAGPSGFASLAGPSPAVLLAPQLAPAALLHGPAVPAAPHQPLQASASLFSAPLTPQGLPPFAPPTATTWLPAVPSALPSHLTPHLTAIAQRAAQLAVAQALSPLHAAPTPQPPPSLQSVGLPPAPTGATVTSTTVAGSALQAPWPFSSTGVPTYQAPAASVGSILSLQAQLPQPPLPPAAALISAFQLAPLNTSIPPIPSKFAAAAAGGEFVDFNELLYCIELGSGEEPPVHVHLADDQQLALSRKPRKRPISSFEEWVKCFTVYANTLCAHQPTRGPDMLGYLFVIASSLQEFTLPAVLAYDVAFRRKAALLKLSPWGHIDPLLYSRAFTGPGKAKANATCPLCLGVGHSAPECYLYTDGPARKARGTPAGPRRPAPSHQQICINFNRGRCLRNDCPRRHVCSVPGCGGPHASLRCPGKRSSPRKP